MTGRISNIMQLGKDIIVTIVTASCEFQGNEIVEVKKQSKKRSLSANAYFHVLSDKLADVMGVSKAYAKNFLLARYGQRELDEDGNVVTLAVKEGIDLMEREDIHTALIGSKLIPSESPYDEDEYYDVYAVIRGTHTYTSAEMNYLITGTVSEAKEQGIETMTPQEIARLEGIAEHYSRK